MTEAMYYILLALLHPGHGYGMMQRIRELSRGRIEMGPGTLYGVLNRMKKEGFIVLTGEEERRKNYAITDAGLQALRLEYPYGISGQSSNKKGTTKNFRLCCIAA